MDKTTILQKDNWLGQRLGAMEETDLLYLFEEISRFQDTGILERGKLRALEEEFSDNVAHTRKGECMRLVEDAVLFEIARRFYNGSSIRTETSLEDSIEKQIRNYIASPDTRVFINRNNELDADKWMYSVEVQDSDGFWLDSFDILEEAENFIKKNNLKKVGES